MKRKHEELSEKIVQYIGGEENVQKVTHCYTRLRFTLKDESKVKTDRMKQTEGVISVLKAGGQYQVVIGNSVGEVYKEVCKKLNITEETEKQEGKEAGGKQSIMNGLISVVTNVFIPCLAVMAALGVLKGILSIFTFFGILSAESSTYTILWALADSLFYFFPVVLGYTAAKKFGLDVITGIVLGASMLYPSLMGEGTANLSFLGIPIMLPSESGYASTVFPVVLAVWFASKIEKVIKERLPEIIRGFMTPLIVLVVTLPVTLIVLGPITTILSGWIGDGFMTIYDFNPAIMGLLLGGLWQVLVMIGLHWGLVPLCVNNVITLGYDMLSPIVIGAFPAQTGMTLGIMLRTKDKRTKSLCAPAVISGIFGVTEPAIYGVTLPRKTPFAATCVVSGIAGMLVCMVKAKTYSMGASGIFCWPTFINPNGGDLTSMIQIIAITVGSFLVSMIIGMILIQREEKNMAQEIASDEKEIKENNSEMTVSAPINGVAVSLQELNDGVFSEGVLGNGCGIRPDSEIITAPFDGIIVQVADTKHAVGIVSPQGVETLIHVGIDTVAMNGNGFQVFVKEGEQVKCGQKLLAFDREKIAAAGYQDVTAIIVTNSDDYESVALIQSGKMMAGEDLLKVTKKN